MKARMKLLEMVKAELNAGRLSEWGMFSNGMDGYAITELSEEDILATLLKWMPVVKYKVILALNIHQTIEALKRATATIQAE